MKMALTKVGGKEPGGKPQAIGRWTFQTSCVRTVVESHLEGTVLNACCGKTKLRHGTADIVRNDINTDRDADHHIDVCVIDDHFSPGTFDVVLFDPPFDQDQADEHYDGMHASDLNQARQALATLTAPGGKLIEFGWSSHGADAYKGWKREELRLFQRGPCLQDVIMTVDKNHQTTLREQT
jgi:hypothetical protein